jgi:hypothetical protein
MNRELNWSLEKAVKVKLKNPDDFLKVKETLQRIGVASYSSKTLYQTAHILHKRGEYYIIHFKCLFALDGKTAIFDEIDWYRQNAIAKLLDDWGLVEIVSDIGPCEEIRKIKIIKHSEKYEWNLVSKYNIGK